MARSLRHQVDEQILDRAAGLFARHGFSHTSLKTVADAVGLSKPGLLHHYPSKEALFEATMALGRAHTSHVLDRVAHLPPGVGRDRAAVALLVDFALARPGLIALASRAISTLGADSDLDPRDRGLVSDDREVFEIFGVDPGTAEPGAVDPGAADRGTADSARLIRVVGMLGALAVLSLAASHGDASAAWRPHIITTCLDALGHHGPAAPGTDPTDTRGTAAVDRSQPEV